MTIPLFGGPSVEGDPGDLAQPPTQLGTGREDVHIAFIAWGDPLTDPTAQIGQQHFDAILSEDHSRTTLVTEHSVEQGSAVVDHVRPNPDELTLEAFVTNTPVYSDDAQLLPLTLDIPQPGQDSGLLSFLNGGTSAFIDKGLQLLKLQRGYPTQLTANVEQFDGDHDYVQNCFDTLTRLRNTATILSISTPRQFYSNMILVNVRMRRSKDQGGSSGAIFTMDFRQIRIVTSKIVDAPTPSIPRPTPIKSVGKKDVQPPKREDNESVRHYAKRTGQSAEKLLIGGGGP
jgi:hypothetical protein